MIEKIKCSICAWRNNCKKRFLIESDTTLNCPDFTLDVKLKKDSEKKEKRSNGDRKIFTENGD